MRRRATWDSSPVAGDGQPGASAALRQASSGSRLTEIHEVWARGASVAGHYFAQRRNMSSWL